MTLNKRYRRNIRENLSFYIAATVLTIVSLLLFYLFYIAGTGIMSYGDAFFEKYHLEDATFTTYMEIPDEDLDALEEKYDVTLEKEHFINIDEDDFNVRVFKKNEKIDLYEVTDGEDVTEDDEIIISKGYAENMGVVIGDKINIRDKTYRVCGYFLRPDYLYMLENSSDGYKNITTFFLAYMTDDAYEALDSQSCQYKVIYSEDSDESAFRKEINDTYITGSYLASENNSRITMVDDQSWMFIIMAFVFLVTLPLVTVALISIIIGRKVKNEQKMIGTLAALGYKKGQLMFHYSVLAMIPGLVGGILVSVITKIIAQPYGEMGLADYEPMPVKFDLPVWIALLGIVLPTALYMLAGANKVRKLLKKDTVTLLNGNVGGESKIRQVMVGKIAPVRRIFAARSILSNPGRSFVVFLGAFLGAFIIAVSFMFADSFYNLVDRGKDDMGSFEYEYVLNTLETEPLEDADELVIGQYEHNGAAFTMMGADSNVKYLNIETTDGKRANLSEGYYITNVMAYSYDLKAGDTFDFVNPVTMEEKNVKISGVIANNSQSLLVCGADHARDLLGLDADMYNGILSQKKIDLGDKISKTVTAADIREQMQTIIDEMGTIIYSLAVIGAIICIAALYVSVNMLVTENRHNISMLKVLGLRSREINRMVLDVNHVLIPIGIVLGLLSGCGCVALIFKIYSGMEGVLYTSYISPQSVVLTIIIVIACYAVSLFAVRKKADRVDMIESLKDNRE